MGHNRYLLSFIFYAKEYGTWQLPGHYVETMMSSADEDGRNRKHL